MLPFLFASLIIGALPGYTDIPPMRVALLPFEDRAGFQGEWELARDVPELLGVHLSALPGISVVSIDALQEADDLTAGQDISSLGKKWRSTAHALDVDVLIRGRINKFGVRRTMAGDPNTLGYRSYTHSVHLDEVELIDGMSGSVLSTLAVSKDSVERPLDLSLFGKPNAQDREFRALLSAQFASDAFFGLTFGQHVRTVFDQLSQDIADSLLGRRPIALREDAKALAVDGREIYLNVGNGDLIRRGDLFSVLQNGQPVGTVRIAEIIGQNLSKASIVENEIPIEVGLSLGAHVVPGDTKN